MGIIEVLPLLYGRVYHCYRSIAFQIAVVCFAGSDSISFLAGINSSVRCPYLACCIGNGAFMFTPMALVVVAISLALGKYIILVSGTGSCIFISVVQSVSSFLWIVLSSGSITVYVINRKKPPRSEVAYMSF